MKFPKSDLACCVLTFLILTSSSHQRQHFYLWPQILLSKMFQDSPIRNIIFPFQKPVHLETPGGNGVILYLFLIFPLQSWHGDTMPCMIILQCWMRRHKYCIREKNSPRLSLTSLILHWLHLPLFFLVHIQMTQWANRGDFLKENAEENKNH